MYLAFNSQVHIHETEPPYSTDILWIQTPPVDRVVPTCNVFVKSVSRRFSDSKQIVSIYKFEKIPQIRVFSNLTKQWEVCLGAYSVISSDGYVLQDLDGKYLITKKGNQV